MVILVASAAALLPGDAAMTAGATFCNHGCSTAELVALVGKPLAARRRLAGQPPPA